MHIPDRFRELLRLEFDGRFRIRWSAPQQLFLLEEKVQRGDPLYAKKPAGWVERVARANPDRLEQVRDGYSLTLRISPSLRRKCEGCWNILTLASQQMRATKCRCGKENILAYWPLDDVLLTHLRSIDVDRGWYLAEQRAIDEADRTRQQRVRAKSKGLSREMHQDDFNQLFGVPLIGSSGTRPMAAWPSAPESPHLRQEASPS